MTAKTVQTLQAGDRFTGTASNGASVTLTVAPPALAYNRRPVVRIDSRGRDAADGVFTYVYGVEGSAKFHTGTIVDVVDVVEAPASQTSFADALDQLTDARPGYNRIAR